MNVSYYKTKEQVKDSHEVSIDKLMKAIKDGKWKTQVNQYRETGDSVIKLSLPCFTGSGVFTKRNAAGLKDHSGFLIIDIDKVKDPVKVKEVLSGDRFTSWCFLSASGNGVAVVVKINGDKHLESFKGLQQYYMDEYGISIDPSCKDVSRLRFISFDPELSKGNGEQFILNVVNKTRIFDIVQNMISAAPDGEKHHTLVKASYLMGGYVSGNVIQESEAVQCLEQAISQCDIKSMAAAQKTIAKTLKDGMSNPIYADEVHEFREQTEHRHKASRKCYGMALGKCMDGVELTDQIYDEIAQEVLLNIKDVRRIVDRVYEQNKDGFGINDKPKIYQIEYYLKRAFDLRRNVVLQTTEVKLNGKWELCNVDSIYRKMQHDGQSFSMDKLKSLLRSDYVDEYCPFHDYFNRLPEWDGETDYIDQLSDYVVTSDQEFWKQQFKKALVRSIACSLDHVENRIIMVLVGEKQSTGKSTFIRFLSPFKEGYYTESPLRDNKDSAFQLAENFIYNLEELDSLTKMDIGKLKSIISSSVIRERKPYAADIITVPRRCNFWGSTNKTDFLTDESNTRWLCFDIMDINWKYKQEVDMDKVWSQAFSMYREGFEYTLTKDEQVKRDHNNKDFESSCIEKDLVMQYLLKSDDIFKSNAEIFEILQKNYGANLTLSQWILPRVMGQLGFKKGVKKINGMSQRGWYCETNLFDQSKLDENLPF